MKVYRFYNEKNGRFYMRSVLIDNSPESTDPPREFCKASANIDPFKIKKQSIRFDFVEDISFFFQLKEVEHFSKILSTMFNPQ